MPNSNRVKGDRVERLVKKQLEANGYVVVRSAGSIGVYDLIAIRKRISYFIQVKSSSDFKSLLRECKKAFNEILTDSLNCQPHTCQVLGWMDRKKIVIELSLHNYQDGRGFEFNSLGGRRIFFETDLPVILIDHDEIVDWEKVIRPDGVFVE